MKKSRKLAESYGYKVAYFVGDNIRVQGGTVRGVVDTENKTVMVRADHPDLTPLQIMRHEMGHAAIAKGDFTLAELRQRLLKDFTDAEIDEMVEVYRSAYSGILDAGEAFEEICCDALGKINIFAGTKQNSASYVKAQRNIRKYAAEKNGSKGRAPPESGSTMYSREVNGKQIAWIEDNPLSLKDLTNYKKVAAYIANHIGEAYTIIESGNKVYLGESLPNEYTQSEYTKRILKNVPPILKAKNKAIGSFGEMIEIATNRRWEKAKHTANKDAKYGVYRYSTAFAFPVKQNDKITNVKSFDAELVILNSSDGKKYLYDIVNIKENTADEVDLLKRDQMRQNAAARRGVSENSIRSSEENVKKNTAKTAEKFSREPESDRYIVALDDANIDELKKSLTLDKAIDLLDAQTGLSYRLNRSANPMSRAGYAMFADNINSIEDAYGGSRPKAFSVEKSALTPIWDITQDIIDARHRTDEETPWILEDHERLSDDEFAALFDPEDIVISAAAYDDEDLVSWLWDNVLEPNNIIGVETYDGAIAFDTDIIKRNLPAEVACTQLDADNTTKTAEKFSMETPVEQKENLIALHNLDETKLLKTLKLGGFPMPSIAITKSDIPHTNFGNITIVFGKETIDPKLDERNTVYSADAWTPTFPQIEYEASPKTEQKIRDIYYPLSRKYGFDFTRPLYESANYLGDTLTRYGGEKGLMEKFADDIDMMNVFLAASGKEPIKATDKEIVTRLPDTEVEMYDYLANAIGEETVYDMQMKSGENPISAKRRWVSEHEQDIISAWQGYLTDVVGMSREAAEAETSEMEAKSLTQTFVKVRNYLKNGAETRRTEPDTDAQRKAIRAAVNKTEYKAWLENLYSGAVKNSGVYNNKDVYTSSGNRRSFKALHFPATLDGIVSAMASQNKGSTKNVSGFHGVKTLRAGTAERFGSIEDMHKLEGRLSHLTEEEAGEIHNALSDRLSTQMNEIYNLIPHSGNDYIGLDALGEIYMEAAELKYKSPANVKALFKEYRYNLSDKQANDIVALLFDINNMPVNIFEAKPERAVSFDEIRKVIIPDTSSDELRTALKNAGIENVEEYPAGDDAARMEIANAVPNVHFSRENVPSRQTEDKYFARQIDKWDGKDHGGAFRVGGVSEPLLKVGIPDTDIWFDQSKAAKQLLEKGEITKDVIKQIPEILQHPIAISESYDNTVMVFGRVFDENKKPIVVALRVNSTKRRNNITLVNKIRSVGSRSHNLDKLLDESSILYLGNNKKETKAWFNALGRSTPFGGTKFGLIRSVSFADAAVKTSREPETLNELRRQNKVLRERVDYWKRQTKPTKVKQLRKSRVLQRGF